MIAAIFKNSESKTAWILSVVIHAAFLFFVPVRMLYIAEYNVVRDISSIEINLVSVAPDTTPSPEEINEPVHTSMKKPAVDEGIVFQEKIEDLPRQAQPESKKETFNKVYKDASADIHTRQNEGALIEARPVAFKNKPPAYPRKAVLSGYQGMVVLKVEVLSSGESRTIEIIKSSGYSMLDSSALKAIRRWRFRPATRNDRPVDSWLEIPIKFKIDHST